MTIIVEDGSIVTGANSYVSAAALESYAEVRGVTLSNDSEVLLLKAMDYFESFSDKFLGYRVERDQPLSFPRADLYIESWSWSSTEIPRQVLNAVLTLALEISAGEDPFNPSVASLPVTRERVEGAVEVEYANPNPVSKVTKTQPSSVHIRLLLRNSGLFAIRA